MNKKKLVGGRVLNIAGIVGCILILPVLIIMLSMMVQRCFEPNVPPNFMGYTPLAVSSGSMSPVFEVNDMIIVDSNDTDVVDGDIISYWSGDILVTHRIIATEQAESGENMYVTQGDANNSPDRVRVSANQVYGTYVTHVPMLGGISLFLSSSNGLIFCIIFVCLIIVVCITVFFWKKYKALQAELVKK